MARRGEGKFEVKFEITHQGGLKFNKNQVKGAKMAIIKVDLQKSYRILNPGATTLVSAKYDGDVNAMAIT